MISYELPSCIPSPWPLELGSSDNMETGTHVDRREGIVPAAAESGSPGYSIPGLADELC